MTYEWNKNPLEPMTYSLTWRARCPIIQVLDERTQELLNDEILLLCCCFFDVYLYGECMKINLVVDYEDQVDWSQDSVVIEKVDLDQDHYNLIVELEQAVFDATRFMINPPSSHIQIMGYSPADSKVVVKEGVNYWHDDENIFI